MRTARRVIVCLLAFVAAAVVCAQQPKPAEAAVDSSVTVTGRDDSLIEVPAPGDVQEQVLPPLDLLLADLGKTLEAAAPADGALVPPILPPVADISLPPREVVFMPMRPKPAVE